MKDLMTIFRRELAAYFNSAIAYIFLIVFSVVTCGVYMLSFFLIERVEMRSFFGILPMMLIVFIPAITMRLWAEDRKIGTYELLLDLSHENPPLGPWKILRQFCFLPPGTCHDFTPSHYVRNTWKSGLGADLWGLLWFHSVRGVFYQYWNLHLGSLQRSDCGLCIGDGCLFRILHARDAFYCSAS